MKFKSRKQQKYFFGKIVKVPDSGIKGLYCGKEKGKHKIKIKNGIFFVTEKKPIQVRRLRKT